jgi:hypothetical protein
MLQCQRLNPVPFLEPNQAAVRVNPSGLRHTRAVAFAPRRHVTQRCAAQPFALLCAVTQLNVSFLEKSNMPDG